MSASDSAIPTRDVSVAPGVGGFLAQPRGRTGDGIVILMEAYGLNEFVRATCRDFARAGYVACAPDLYHGDVIDYGNRQGAMAKLATLNDATIMSEVAGALDVLESEGARRNAVIGFCMGGRAAFLANATHGSRLRASISFYGGSIAPDEHARLAQALTAANKRYSIAVFPDAPHAFATFDRDSYREPQARAAFRAAHAFLDEAYGRRDDERR